MDKDLIRVCMLYLTLETSVKTSWYITMLNYFFSFMSMFPNSAPPLSPFPPLSPPSPLHFPPPFPFLSPPFMGLGLNPQHP